MYFFCVGIIGSLSFKISGFFLIADMRERDRQRERERGRNNPFNRGLGQYVLPAMPKSNALTPLGPIMPQ